MDKIVFLRYLPLTEKVKNDFFFRELSEAGFCVEYWDITPLFFNNESGLEHYSLKDTDRFEFYRIDNRKDFDNSVSENKHALFVLIMTFEWRIMYIFRILTKYNCRKAVFAFRPLPFVKGTIANYLQRPNLLKSVIKSLANRSLLPFLNHVGYLKLYDYCFTAGIYGWIGAGLVKKELFKNTKFFQLNNGDYDRFLNSNEELVIGSKYILFIDEYYPFHPDASLFTSYRLDAKVYYDDLNRVFSLLEEKYCIPVIIAAHPKAIKYKERDYFNGRKVLFDSTLPAIKGSTLVLAHDSTAIGYAIMSRKPLLFLNSSQIKTNYHQNYNEIKHLASLLASPMVMSDSMKLSELPDRICLSEETMQVYSSLKYGYMTTLDSNQKNGVLVVKYMNEIFKR